MKAEKKCNYYGAKGVCKICGTQVSLEWGDTVLRHRTYGSWNADLVARFGKEYDVWDVKCPVCDHDIECTLDAK